MRLLHGSIDASGIVHLQHAFIFNSTTRGRRPKAKETRRMSAIEMFTRMDTAGRGRMANFLNGVTVRVQQYKTYRQTLEELDHLSDRELTDLGISRTQLRSIAYRAAYGG